LGVASVCPHRTKVAAIAESIKRIGNPQLDRPRTLPQQFRLDNGTSDSVLIAFMVKASRPPGPLPTIGELQRDAPHWCWIYCGNAFCARIYRPTAITLAPYVIRWGAEASSNMLRRCARCTVCGHKGATLSHQGDDPEHDNYAAFPAEHALRLSATIVARSRSDAHRLGQ
jgi:hypothetical protein